MNRTKKALEKCRTYVAVQKFGCGHTGIGHGVEDNLLQLLNEAFEELAWLEKREPTLMSDCISAGLPLDVALKYDVQLCRLTNYVRDKTLADCVKQEPVALSFPREPKPENAMGWTIDYGLIRQIAEDIGDQEFYPGYEGIELTLMALEHIYTAQVPDRLAAAAHDLLKELQECRDLLKCVETCSRNNFENLADERVQAINAAIAAFKEKNK